MRILYLAVGDNDPLHTQALYAAMSALAWGDAAQAVHLVTDRPERYLSLAGLVQVEAPPASPQASPNFEPFKLKLAAVRELATRFPEDAILFCDADTFFTAPYGELAERLLNGGFAMHRREYSAATHPTGQMKKFLRALDTAGMLQSLLARDPELAMWNSGVIGLPPGSARVMDSAQDMLQTLAPLLPPHYPAEQFSVAMAMPGGTAILPAENCIFHYWYQKAQYTLAIRNRLRLWSDWPMDQQIATLRRETLLLTPPPQKLHWWEKALIAARLRTRPQDSRGLPRH
jgi:hypothetical protein